MKLTKNFNLNEFTNSANIAIVPTKQQVFCLQVLCETLLQPVRDHWGPVKITSGLRNWESYERLLKRGYEPSRTSNHFAWCEANPYGTGAADFTIKADMGKVYVWIKSNLFGEYGQVIYYAHQNFIHISNLSENIFQMADDRENLSHIDYSYGWKG